MGGEKKFVSGSDPREGTKPSRIHAYPSADLHGPRPEDKIFKREPGMRDLSKHQDNERTSLGDIAAEMEAAFGFRPEVGACFTDTAEPNEVYEITHVQANGGIEVTQTSNKSGGNYIARRVLSRAWLETVIEENLQGTRRLSLYELSVDDYAELEELVKKSREESNQNGDRTIMADSDEPVILKSSVVVPEDASVEGVLDTSSQSPVVGGEDKLAGGDPPGMTRPKQGTIRGSLYGGKTVAYVNSVPTVLPNGFVSEVLLEGSQDEKAIDAQQPTGGRRRRGSSNKVRSQSHDGAGGTLAQPPKSLEVLGAQDIGVQPKSTDNNPVDTMKFEPALSVTSKQAEEQSVVDILGEDDLSQRALSVDQQRAPVQAGANDEELIGFGRTYEESEVKVKEGGNESGSDQYKDGSVWVEEYLKETDRQADVQEAFQREPAPVVVRTRDNPFHTVNQQTQSRELGERGVEGLGDIEVAPSGSAEEAAVLAAYGRGPRGETGVMSEEQLRENIAAATLACDQARLEYVTADNESRTVMSRLRGVLGISGKGIQNETVGQKKEAYQNKLRELRDLRLEMVKMRYANRVESPANLVLDEEEEPNPDLAGEESDLKREELFSVAEDEHSLEKELEAEFRHFAQEVNIGLYNAWTELKSEQKGVLGKLKQFGASYNQLSWKKKLVIGIPVAGLAVVSGAGLLGTAMASVALAAVLARRGVAAAGMFAAADGGLQKLAENRARKMTEKIVAKGQQEAQSLENLDQGDVDEAGRAGSEASSSPEANVESLDVKLERMKAFMDNHMIDSLDQTLESRVRGHDRRRLGALAGSMGVAFGLPSFLASETGHELTHATGEKVATGAGRVGEVVFGDDYPQVKPADALSVSPNEATVGAKAAAPGTIERGASGAALESSSSAKGVELGAKISGILGKEITLVKGDSVWKLAGNMTKELGVKGEAKSLYVTDALKDAYLAHGGNPNIQAGAAFDWKKYVGTNDIQKILKAASNLTAEQEASILANKGKVIASAAIESNSSPQGGTSAGVTEVAGVQTKYPEVLARAREQLGIGAQEDAVASNSDVKQVTDTDSIRAFDGVRPEQSFNTTGFYNIPGVGLINLAELQSVEQRLQAFPEWTVLQMAEAGKDSAKIPNGITADDMRQMKQLFARIPGTHTKEFILQNGSMPVQQFVQEIRTRISQSTGVLV